MAVWTRCQFFFSLASWARPERGERVDFHAASALGFAPLSGDPPFFSEAMQGREERSGSDHEYAVSHLLDAVGDADAVERAKFQGAENEEIEGSLQEFRRLAHAGSISTVDIECQERQRKHERVSFAKTAPPRFRLLQTQ